MSSFSLRRSFQDIQQYLWLLWLRLNNWEIVYNGIKLDLQNEQIQPRRTFSFSFRVNKGAMHEEEEMQFLQRHLNPDMDVIELGAGIGFISCFVNNIISNSCTQVSVEGNTKLIPNLERNKQLNHSSFKIEHKAYSPVKNEVSFNLGESYLTASTKADRVNHFWGPNRTVEETLSVEAISLESLAESYQLKQFSLIVDIEGDEIDLINGELEILRERCKFILIEFHYHPDNPDAAEDAKQTLLDSQFELIESSGRENMVETCVFENIALR